jgi:hypothetical protein
MTYEGWGPYGWVFVEVNGWWIGLYIGLGVTKCWKNIVEIVFMKILSMEDVCNIIRRKTR